MLDKYPSVALAMIVNAVDSEASLLKECLESIKDHVDGIYLTLTHKPDERVSEVLRSTAEKYTHSIYIYEWDDNFVKARNYSFLKVPKRFEWIVWLDSDDTVEKPEKIKELAAIVSKSIDAIYVSYDYDHDEYGNVITSHRVARLVRNNGSHQWQSSFADSDVSVHEVLAEKRGVNKKMTDDFKIIHHSNPDRRYSSLLRNISLLEGMYQRQLQKTNIDPRTLYYLATHYYDAGRFKDAKMLFSKYLEMSGWNEERSEAFVYLGLIYSAEGDYGRAEQCYLMSIGEDVDNPRPYVEISQLQFKEKRYRLSAKWAQRAIDTQRDPTTIVLSPMEGAYRAYMLKAQAFTNIGGDKLEDAQELLTKALELRPLDPDAQASRDLLEELINQRDLTRSYVKLAKEITYEKDDLKMDALLMATPKILQDNPAVANIRAYHLKPRIWPKKSMVIYTGASLISGWGPWSLEEGIGGSEEAVIRLNRELSNLGWKITVYGSPGNRAGNYEGTEWRHYWEFNPNDEFDVVVSWRTPWFFDMDIKARKKYLWLHDMENPNEFTEKRLKNLDKVIVLSQYHRRNFPLVPEDKIFYSANGIDRSDFDSEDDKHKRDPYRLIWMSSHVRGLEMLYHIWPDLKKKVPKATLDVYYGWESFESVHKENSERMQWKRWMEKQAKELDGVTDHGKLGQYEIVKEIFKSGIWAYPCPFPEISCITAMKAQAGGAIPVSSNFAALEETVQWGVKVPMRQVDERTPVGRWDKSEIKKFEDALIEMLDPKKQSEVRSKMMKGARDTFSWVKVAKSWNREMQ